MDYVQLTDNIKRICENTFTDAELAMFTQQAEQKIYNTVQMPALRATSEVTLTIDIPLHVLPSRFLWVYSFNVTDALGNVTYLLNKDVNFINEAYPDPTYRGLPKYYGYYNESSAILGPIPDQDYTANIEYGRYPTSLVNSESTWLGEEFDSALLNGALVEAIRYMKGEEDLAAMYEKMYLQALSLLKGLSDGKLRRDAYRSGQLRLPPT